jgi:hypothetical protein
MLQDVAVSDLYLSLFSNSWKQVRGHGAQPASSMQRFL